MPDCVRRLYSVRQATHKGYRVILDSNKPGLWVCEQFIQFTNDPETNLWLLPLFPPTSKDNGIYPLPSYSAAPTPKSADEIPEDLQALRQQWLMEHHRLGHPSQKRQADVDIKSNRPPPTQKEERSHIPWEDIHSDLSGKIATQSARGYKYFIVFVCTYTGAKHVEFLSHKNHFILRIPSPGHRAGSSSAYTTHRPRHGISQ